VINITDEMANIARYVTDHEPTHTPARTCPYCTNLTLWLGETLAALVARRDAQQVKPTEDD
jgi:hypothetical protein